MKDDEKMFFRRRNLGCLPWEIEDNKESVDHTVFEYTDSKDTQTKKPDISELSRFISIKIEEYQLVNSNSKNAQECWRFISNEVESFLSADG